MRNCKRGPSGRGSSRFPANSRLRSNIALLVGNVQKQMAAKRAWSILTTENRLFRSALEQIAALTAGRGDSFSRAIHRIAADALDHARGTREKAA